MNPITKAAAEHQRLVWLLALPLIAGLAFLTGETVRELREGERLSQLQLDTQRHGIEVMSQTLNGNHMGALGLIGLMDDEVKREVRKELLPNSAHILSFMESLTHSHYADGTFVVNQEGIIGSSWGVGKPLTGVDINFRPYYRTARQGRINVYAAVGTTTGRRTLYFAAPVHAGNTDDTPAIGAVVIRAGVARLDKLLSGKADIALLLSPQGVVFAGNREEWIGRTAGPPTPERVKEIRQLKQFGRMFDKKDPQPLPMAVAPGITLLNGVRHAVARTPVEWNDPQGPWSLVLMEDLSRTVGAGERWRVMGGTAAALLLVTALMMAILRGSHAQTRAAHSLEQHLHARQRSADRRAAVGSAALRLQQCRSTTELAQRFLGELHALLGALQGAVYVVGNDPGDTGTPFRLAASYACADPPPATLIPGEGLLGQCAVERRMMTVENLESGYWRIHSGLGAAPPTAALMAPILLGETLLGVVEVALLTPPDDEIREMLGDLLKLLALNVEIRRHSERTEAILAETTAAERASAEWAAFQQVLMDTIPYPVFYKGADTRFLGFNRAYEQTFGVNRADLIGKRVLDLEYLPEADRVACQAEDEATIASSGTVQREMQIPFADGKLHDTLYFVSGFRNPDGTPGGVVGTFIDMSPVKDAQRQLARLADVERFNRLAQGRERRILGLKREINALCGLLSQSPRYPAAEMERMATLGDEVDPGELTGEGGNFVQLVWHPTFECGHPEIDQDHQGLFQVANQLLNAFVAGKPVTETGPIVERLAREVTRHFEREEAILASHGYPEAEAHTRIHQDLLERAGKLIRAFQAGQAEAGPFFQFLAYEVVAKHMLREDRRFFPLFQAESGGEPAPGPGRIGPPAVKTPPKLEQLVDLDELQKLFDNFCHAVGVAAAIIDLEGKVLAASRWQRACTDFHRVNPDSCARCIESDTQLALELQDGVEFTLYRCKNGLTDCASPIVVEGHHLANVFIGQFHAAPPDMAFFAAQARRFGYPEEEYLKAIAEAPVLDEGRQTTILGFLARFSRMVATMSLARFRADQAQRRLEQQSETLRQERLAAMSLAEDAEQARRTLERGCKEETP